MLVAKTGINEIHRKLRSVHASISRRYLTDLQTETRSLGGFIFDFFDEAYYLMNNRDVLNYVFAGDINSGLLHFLGWGIHERRSPMRVGDLLRISEHLLRDCPLKSEHGSHNVLAFDELCELLNFIPDELLAK